MKLLKFYVLVHIFLLIIIKSTVVQANVQELNEKQMKYLSAWLSLAVYNDKLGFLSRNILEENGWQIEIFNERIANSDVKFLLSSKKIADKDIYFLSISGTDGWQDIKTDFAVQTVVFAGNNPDDFIKNMNDKQTENKSLVHKGFINYVQDGFFTNKINGFTLGELLVLHLKQHENDKLYITGHSLGGAVAELLGARLLDMGINKQQLSIITFGAPAVGNKIFVDKYEPKMNLTRITMKGDMVKNLSQIANDNLIQFNTNEQWILPKSENDKFAHNMLLYFDKAMRNYYDTKMLFKHDEIDKLNKPIYYVAPIKFNFPKELISEKRYINLALKDKWQHKTFVSFANDKVENPFLKAKQINARYVVFYEFNIEKIRDSISNKRYYLNGSRYIYDVKGNFIIGNNANTDTNEMTLLQSALYVDYQMDNF